MSGPGRRFDPSELDDLGGAPLTDAEAAAMLAIAEANAKAIRQVAEAIESPGGLQAVNLKVAEQYVNAFANIAKTNNTVIVPANLADLAGLITAAMTVFKAQAK